ncbi:MAG: outer membrane protein assembly factor BamA [Halieaceae bacterium]|jgi:outer membrane protein assembly factor BamA
MDGGGYGVVSLNYYRSWDIETTRPIEINTEAFAIIQSLKFKLGDRPLFPGVAQRYIGATLNLGRSVDSAEGFLAAEVSDRQQSLVSHRLTGDTTLSALGLVLELDTRDNFFSPHGGYHYQIEHL